MKWIRKVGYVSVELVITAALIMAVGFFILLNFGTTGSQLMQSGMDKLDALGIFGGGGDTSPVVEDMVYDENGYPSDLNVNPADINPVTDFDFVYSEPLQGWVVVKYNNTADTDVIVPRNHADGRPVVAIGGTGDPGTTAGAFEGTTVASAVLSNKTVLIGEDAFKDSAIASIAIPDTVTTIGSSAFFNGYLESLVIPKSVTNLGDTVLQWNLLTNMEFQGPIPNSLGTNVLFENAFEGPSIKVPAGSLNDYKANANKFGVLPGVFYAEAQVIFDNSVYAPSLGITEADVNSSEDFEFEWNETLQGWMVVYYFNASTDPDVVIPAYRKPDGAPVVGIGERAFYGDAITSVALPNTIVEIQKEAFDSTSLSSVIIPDSTLTIGDYAFYQVPMTSVTLGNNVRDIGTYAFSETLITSIVLPSSLVNLEEGIFYYCESLSSVIIPEGVTSIPSWMFGFNALTEISIPSTVTSIGREAFQWNQLTSIDFNGGNPSIGPGAFNENRLPDENAYIYATPSDTETLMSYAGLSDSPIIPSGTTAIGEYSFKGTNITSVTIPESVTNIRDNAFWGSKFTSVTLPSGLKTIGAHAFYSTKLTSLVIPEGVLDIGDSAFGRTNITTINIPNSVTRIGSSAFAYVPYTTATIGSGVTSIGNYAFGYHNTTTPYVTVQLVRFAGPLPTVIGSNVFYVKSIFTGDIEVPNAYLTDYINAASRFGVATTKFSGY